MKKDLVSIVIPTLNASSSLEGCLKSIKKQTYKNKEIVVVDSFSKDDTAEIAKRNGARVVQTKWRLFGARYLGAKNARGSIVVFIDADQTFQRPDVIESVVEMMKGSDMLVLEERSLDPRTSLEKLTSADRRLVHKQYEANIDPVYGVLRPRAYKKSILMRAFGNMPLEKMYDIVIYDDAIIYYEASKITRKVRMVRNALYQKEVSSFYELFIHAYKYGRTSRKLFITKEYSDILKKKSALRAGTLEPGNIGLGLQSYALLMVKGIGFKLGYWFGA